MRRQGQILKGMVRMSGSRTRILKLWFGCTSSASTGIGYDDLPKAALTSIQKEQLYSFRCTLPARQPL